MSMAVETRRGAATGTLSTPGAAQPLVRYLLWATATALGVSGAAAALISAVSGYLVYQYARAKGVWGTDEPPVGRAEDVSFGSAQDNTRISGWFFSASGIGGQDRAGEKAPAVVLCHGIGTG